MDTSITLQKDDAGIILSFRCRDENRNPIDLTQFSIDFQIYDRETLLNEGRTACTKPDAMLGIAEYTVAPEDTEASGLFYGRIRLQNGVSMVRNIGTIPIVVRDALH